MSCKEHHIRELIPSYLEGSLERDAADLVEQHLAGCSDCAGELDLLRMLAREPVPDPGAAFWASLPDRVHRRVQQEVQGDPSRPSWSFLDLLLSPWTQGAVAAATIVLVSWLVLRPLPRELAKNDLQSETIIAEDLLDAPASVAEMELRDTSGLASWMDRESLQLQDAVERVAAAGSGLDRPLEEYLSALDQRELQDLAATLSEEQEAGS